MVESAVLPDTGVGTAVPAVSLRGVTKVYDNGVTALEYTKMRLYTPCMRSCTAS